MSAMRDCSSSRSLVLISSSQSCSSTPEQTPFTCLICRSLGSTCSSVPHTEFNIALGNFKEYVRYTSHTLHWFQRICKTKYRSLYLRYIWRFNLLHKAPSTFMWKSVYIRIYKSLMMTCHYQTLRKSRKNARTKLVPTEIAYARESYAVETSWRHQSLVSSHHFPSAAAAFHGSFLRALRFLRTDTILYRMTV